MSEPDAAELRVVAERNLCGLVSRAARRLEQQHVPRAPLSRVAAGRGG